jgi:predicted ATPase
MIDLIGSLVEKLENNKLGPYLHYIVFPRFKNFAPGTRLEFDFPVTALVGANGVGKTSILHALWGTPFNYTTAKFWFATELDPINDTSKDPQRYFYGFWHQGFQGIVETKKVRASRENRLDYWEPAKISKRDGMKPFVEGMFDGKAKDRWNPPHRKVEYVNFRSIFGSFDRYFYFDEGYQNDEKQKVMQASAKRIKKVKDGMLKSFALGRGGQRVFENRWLTKNELIAVGNILGRKYDSAQIIRHSLYPRNRGKDLSIIFKRKNQYSEAFAGSGEVAIVSAVVDIMSAKPFSLILLDEPETSLHPGAQKEFLKFLLEQADRRNCQIVMSTHSKDMIESLPLSAIKIIEENELFQSRVIKATSHATAFNRIGVAVGAKKRIIVEDELSKYWVEHSLMLLDVGDRETVQVEVRPGGASAILKYSCAEYAALNADVLILLDGDQRRVETITDPRSLSMNDYSALDELFERELGVKPQLNFSGNKVSGINISEKHDMELKYLGWVFRRLKYLPGIPEDLIMQAFGCQNVNLSTLKEDYIQFIRDGSNMDFSSKEMLVLSKAKISKIPLDDDSIQKTAKLIEAFITS